MPSTVYHLKVLKKCLWLAEKMNEKCDSDKQQKSFNVMNSAANHSFLTVFFFLT